VTAVVGDVICTEIVGTNVIAAVPLLLGSPIEVAVTVIALSGGALLGALQVVVRGAVKGGAGTLRVG